MIKNAKRASEIRIGLTKLRSFCRYKSESVFWRIARQISDLCDFDLLRDPIYVNIMLGMSIAIFAEANFSMLTPFILADMNMETAEIASIMSVIAITDLFSRCAAPFLAKWLRQPPRMMYLLSLSLLIVSRACNVYIHCSHYFFLVAEHFRNVKL